MQQQNNKKYKSNPRTWYLPGYHNYHLVILLVAYDDACGLLEDIDRLVEFQHSIIGLHHRLFNMKYGLKTAKNTLPPTP